MGQEPSPAQCPLLHEAPPAASLVATTWSQPCCLHPPRKPSLLLSELCSGLWGFSALQVAAFNLFTGHGPGSPQGDQNWKRLGVCHISSLTFYS